MKALVLGGAISVTALWQNRIDMIQSVLEGYDLADGLCVVQRNEYVKVFSQWYTLSYNKHVTDYYGTREGAPAPTQSEAKADAVFGEFGAQLVIAFPGNQMVEKMTRIAVYRGIDVHQYDSHGRGTVLPGRKSEITPPRRRVKDFTPQWDTPDEAFPSVPY